MSLPLGRVLSSPAVWDIQSICYQLEPISTSLLTIPLSEQRGQNKLTVRDRDG